MTAIYESPRITRHDQCPMELRVSGPHIGLYCQCHNKWLKWLTDGEARVALEADLPVRIIAKRTQTGQPQANTGNYIKIQQQDQRTQNHRRRRHKARQKLRQKQG